MNLDLSGRRALVGGASQGLGLAVAHELASLGASVTLLARDQARLDEAAAALSRPAGQRHSTLRADFSDPASVRATVGGIIDPANPFHILVHNTGGPPPGPLLDAPVEQFLAAFHAHLITGQHLVQLLVPGMKAARFGRVINIISTSVKQPIPNLGVSNTIRGAVAAWSKTLAAELGPYGITVNNLLPGYTKTQRLASLIKGRSTKSGATEQQVADELIATIPAGRFGEPNEFAAAAAFLASPAAAYINGINLPVDGGRLGCL